MKSKYETNVEPYLEAIEQMARNGMMEKDIARQLHVGNTAWIGYKKKHPKLAKALRTNREIADLAIENALWQSARGYDKVIVEKKYTYRKNDDGSVDEILVEKREKTQHVPPNPVSIQYYLNHRLSGAWGDVSQTDGEGGGVIVLPERTEGEL